MAAVCDTLFPPYALTPAQEYDDAPVPEWSINPAVEEKDLSDKPQWLREPELGLRGGQWTRSEQLQTLMSVDDLVGGLMRQLDSLGEQKRTLAFFLSDNGSFWAEHGLLGKGQPYTQSVQIPFLMRWEGFVEQGVDDDLVSTIDLASTVLAATRIPKAERYPMDGRNLLDSSRVRLLLEHFTEPVKPFPDWASIRTLSYQYVEHYNTDGGVIFREYYDLVDDPWQLTNLLAVSETGSPRPHEIKRLSRTLAGDRRCRGTEGRKACP